MSDVAVIGAGVLGLSVTHHLINKGHSVQVFEQEPFPAVHASGKNAGMFRQLYRSSQLTRWATRSRNTWVPEVREKAITEGVSFVRGRTLPTHDHSLFSVQGDGVECESDCLIDPGSYCSELVSTLGIKVNFSTKICSLTSVDSGFELVDSSGKQYFASKVVNAAGAWAGELVSSKVPIRAYARHLFLLSESLPCLRQYSWFWDEVDNFYTRRWGKDQSLFSVCDLEPAEPERYVPDSFKLTEVAEKLLKHFPDEAANIDVRRSWHCFRTYVEDQLPLFGEDPDLQNFFWLAAFGGFGMSTSWAAAEDLAGLISGESISVDSSVLVERFS